MSDFLYITFSLLDYIDFRHVNVVISYKLFLHFILSKYIHYGIR